MCPARNVLNLVFAGAAVAGLFTGCSKSEGPTHPGGGGGPTFNSGEFNTNSSPNTFVVTFTQEGSWGYRCTLHAGMTGTVDVNAAGLDSPLVQVGSGGNNFNPAVVNVKTGSYVRFRSVTSTNHTVTRP